MRYILDAGTDGACVAIFDAWALPMDFDAQVEEDLREAADQAQDAGNCFITETGGDGTHILHVYVDDVIPASLAGASTLLRKIDSFPIPSGRLWFTGAEYIGRDDFLEPPEVGGESWAGIPKGSYVARLFEVDSEKISEPAHPPPEPTLLGRTLRTARPLLFLITFVVLFLAITSLIQHGLGAETLTLTMILVALGFGIYWISNSPTLKRADAVVREIQREYCPGYILTLERQASVA